MNAEFKIVCGDAEKISRVLDKMMCRHGKRSSAGFSSQHANKFAARFTGVAAALLAAGLLAAAPDAVLAADRTIVAGSTASIDHEDAFGTDALRLDGTLIATYASDEFNNVLTGNGTFIKKTPAGDSSIPGLTLTNAEAFQGTFELENDSVITFRVDGDFSMASTIKGATSLLVVGKGGRYSLESADQIDSITRGIDIYNMTFTVDEKAAGKSLLTDDGTVLKVNGQYKLKDLAIRDTTLHFTGLEASGSTIPGLTVDRFRPNGMNRIVIDDALLSKLAVPDGSGKERLTAQDVLTKDQSTDLKAVLIRTDSGIKGSQNAGFTLTDENGNEITQGNKTFGISDKSGVKVADGTYGYSGSMTENEVGISWLLREVSILEGKTLELSGKARADNTLSAKLTGSGNFTASSGAITLAAENDYSGVTTVNAGAEIIAANDKSLGRTSGLKNRGIVTLDGQKIAVDGRTENSGTINVGMGTFTTTSYTGTAGSVIAVDALVSENAATSGKFVVSGAASGRSRLNLNLLDGSLDRAVAGIDVIQLGEGSTLELELSESVKAGDYYYRLMKTDDGSGYYLVSSLTDGGTTAMTTSELMTPENGSRAALAFMNQRAFDFGLNTHIGEKPYVDLLTGERKTTTLWLVQSGSWSRMDDASGQLKNRGHMFTTNLGGDILAWNTANGRASVGFLGGWADGSYDVDSNVTGLKADADMRGWSLGAYAAWQPAGESGLFANAQIRWNDFTNEVKGQDLAKEKYHARGISLGMEAGWNQRLWTKAASDGGRRKVWDAAPFARVAWSGVSADDYTDAYGQRFSVEDDGSTAISLGVRTSFAFGVKGEKPHAAEQLVRVYAEGAWVHNTGTFESTVVSRKGSSRAQFGIDDYGQFRLGAEGEFAKNFFLRGDVTHEAGRESYSSTGFTIGAKYVF